MAIGLVVVGCGMSDGKIRLALISAELPLAHCVHRWNKDSACRCSRIDGVMIVDVPVDVSASVSPRVVKVCER
jgi:hypothetical protein